MQRTFIKIPHSTIIYLFLALILTRNTCVGQERPTLTLEYFNYTTSYRQSVCERQAQLDNETLQLRDALVGLQLSTWLFKDNRYVRFDETTNAIDSDDPGLIGVLLDELADRARFTWRNSFGIIDDITLPEGKTFSDLLVWSVWAYDVSAVYWSKSPQRMDRGASFPEGWYDGRMIMVGVEEEENAGLDLWSFLEPFTTGVWIMIIVTIVVSALVYWFLDWYDTNSDEMRLGNKPLHNLFLSSITFTGHFEFKPTTNSARIFTVSFTFWSLIVMSAYTANLASFLVVQNTPSITIDTLGDAVRNNYQICVVEGSNTDEAVTRAFPGARVVRLQSEQEIYIQLREGRCDITVSTVSSFQEYRMDRNVNGDCRMAWIGRNFVHGEGGFATKSDSGTLCTSLIRDVFNLHMVEMKNDGFVQRAWEEHLTKQATVDCDDAALSADDEDESSDGQLTLQAMGGTFIIHYIATAFAIFLAVAAQLYRNKPICKGPPAAAETQVTESKGVDAMEQSQQEVDGGVGIENGTCFVNESSSQSELQNMLKEQNEKLSALSNQNAQMMQMIIDMKSESSATLPMETSKN